MRLDGGCKALIKGTWPPCPSTHLHVKAKAEQQIPSGAKGRAGINDEKGGTGLEAAHRGSLNAVAGINQLALRSTDSAAVLS